MSEQLRISDPNQARAELRMLEQAQSLGYSHRGLSGAALDAEVARYRAALNPRPDSPTFQNVGDGGMTPSNPRSLGKIKLDFSE